MLKHRGACEANGRSQLVRGMVLFIIQNHDLDFDGMRILPICRGTAVGMYVESHGTIIFWGCAPFLQDKVFVRLKFVKSDLAGKIRLFFEYSRLFLI